MLEGTRESHRRGVSSGSEKSIVLSAFRTREDRQPTSEFVAACPCPDGLMQDETQAGGMRLILSCTRVLVVGVTSVARARERERGFGLEVRCLSFPPPRLSYSACLCSPAFAPLFFLL
jgi:hypothetical protein